MKARHALVLQTLLNRSSPEKKAELARFLPEEERISLAQMPHQEPSSQGLKGLVLEGVHWSWFLPALKSYREKEQKLFLYALGGEAEQSLLDELHLSSPENAIGESGVAFLRGLLLHSLVGPEENLLPKECLPASPLNALFKCGK